MEFPYRKILFSAVNSWKTGQDVWSFAKKCKRVFFNHLYYCCCMEVVFLIICKKGTPNVLQKKGNNHHDTKKYRSSWKVGCRNSKGWWNRITITKAKWRKRQQKEKTSHHSCVRELQGIFASAVVTIFYKRNNANGIKRTTKISMFHANILSCHAGPLQEYWDQKPDSLNAGPMQVETLA